MSYDKKTFDVLILGTGPKALKALEAVQATGQTALWIDMDQGSLTTLVCQKNRSSSTSTDQEENQDYQIFVDQHTITTPTVESTTFILQPQPIVAESLASEEIYEEIPDSAEETHNVLEENPIYANSSSPVEVSEEKETEEETVTKVEFEELEESSINSSEEWNSELDESILEELENEVHDSPMELIEEIEEKTPIKLEDEIEEAQLEPEKIEEPVQEMKEEQVEDTSQLEENTKDTEEKDSPPEREEIEEEQEVLEANIRREIGIPRIANRDIVIGSRLIGQKSLLWSQSIHHKSKRTNLEDSLLGNQIFGKLLQKEELSSSNIQEESTTKETNEFQATFIESEVEETTNHTEPSFEEIPVEITRPSLPKENLAEKAKWNEFANDYRPMNIEEVEVIPNKFPKPNLKERRGQISQIDPEKLKKLIKVDLPSQSNKDPVQMPNPELKKIEIKRPSVFPLETFGSRRRSRAQKKSRIFANIESISEPISYPNPAPEKKEPPQSVQTPKTETFPENDPEEIKSPTNELKRDNIEFEDAYGGYSSWEEFLTPFSHGNRKRQEMDKLEKRKIALRGLHNLINNLG